MPPAPAPAEGRRSDGDTPLPVPYSIKRHGLTLANCDDEPVQTPGCIQAHGMLLALRVDDLVVRQISDNCLHWLGRGPDQVLGQPLASVVGDAVTRRVQALVRTEVLERNPCYVATSRLPAAPDSAVALDMTLHTADGVLLLEMEPSTRPGAGTAPDGDHFAKIRQTIGRLKATHSLDEFCDVVAHEARSLTGLDRAMVYRFHADDSGEVVADARRDDLPSWLGLRYPAQDIPRPAREIFKKIGVRPLPDAQGALCEMVPLRNPDTGRPLEMTHCALRGASVMYTEYLQNMGVAATLTMPILRDGALWGLIACHHQQAAVMPYPMRSAAEFLAQVVSLEIAQAEAREHLQYRIQLDTVHLAVLARAAGDGQLSVGGEPALLDGIQADGVAVYQRGQWQTAGHCPAVAELEPLGAWLRDRVGEAGDSLQVHATDALGAAYPAAAGYARSASGVLATAVSRHPGSALIVWFRGEQLQTFNWAGNPHDKPAIIGPQGPRLTPRRSFDLWQEQVRGRSAPWRAVEIDAAERLRRMVMDLVVLRAERLAETNADLARSNAELDAFAYVVGHDLKEPLRGINKQAHRLMEDAKAGRAQDAERLQWLLRMTVRMDTLLDALLHYAQVGRLSLDITEADLSAVLVEATEMLGARLIDNPIELRVPRPLPVLRCDRARVREVFSNLISNAAKYNDQPPAVVEVGYIGVAEAAPAVAVARPLSMPPEAGGDTIFYVRDNGIGIESRHRDRVFAIFKRLHAQDAFGGGSGAGLTIARKMVEQHHGLIWFDSQPGQGSTFYFTLPDAGMPDKAGRDA